MTPRAFVFDDDPVLRALLEITLHDRGYEVITFPPPGVCPSAFSPVCECPPDRVCADVVISSVLQPIEKGLDWVERQLKKGCQIRHVGLVADTWKETERSRAQQLGCRVFSRPVDVDQFHQWLVEVEKGIDPERKLSEKYQP